MAKAHDIQIKMDEWIKQTRVYDCENIDCEYNQINFTVETYGCFLKGIAIEKIGKCRQYKSKVRIKAKKKNI